MSAWPLIEDLRDDFDLHEHVVERIEAQELRGLMRALPEIPRVVLAFRYGLVGPPLRDHEVGRRLGINPAAVRRIERRALLRLRQEYRSFASSRG